MFKKTSLGRRACETGGEKGDREVSDCQWFLSCERQPGSKRPDGPAKKGGEPIRKRKKTFSLIGLGIGSKQTASKEGMSFQWGKEGEVLKRRQVG